MSTTPSAPHPRPAEFHVYDTTLRDGAQQEGLRLSVQDKLRIAGYLDELGVDYIEGGWPGANPNDTAFFAAATSGELTLKNATLTGGRRPADRRAPRLRRHRRLCRGQKP
jgi:2-isopropylmalate synthase